MFAFSPSATVENSTESTSTVGQDIEASQYVSSCLPVFVLTPSSEVAGEVKLVDSASDGKHSWVKVLQPTMPPNSSRGDGALHLVCKLAFQKSLILNSITPQPLEKLIDLPIAD
jgi:hypothetical protein